MNVGLMHQVRVAFMKNDLTVVKPGSVRELGSIVLGMAGTYYDILPHKFEKAAAIFGNSIVRHLNLSYNEYFMTFNSRM